MTLRTQQSTFSSANAAANLQKKKKEEEVRNSGLYEVSNKRAIR